MKEEQAEQIAEQWLTHAAESAVIFGVRVKTKTLFVFYFS